MIGDSCYFSELFCQVGPREADSCRKGWVITSLHTGLPASSGSLILEPGITMSDCSVSRE